MQRRRRKPAETSGSHTGIRAQANRRSGMSSPDMPLTKGGHTLTFVIVSSVPRNPARETPRSVPCPTPPFPPPRKRVRAF
ncbi:hypothetical protein [Azospirillum argentinense]